MMETQDCIYIVMEYATGGELFDYIVAHKRVKEKEARSFFRQVISAVDYCHQNAVIHRDLKPENLLLDQTKNIKIIDFGFGNTYKSDGLLDTFCGSPFYAAPEMILGKRYEGPEVDMWSLGVILFALLCGHLPFDDENMKELYKKIAHGTYTIPEYVPAPCRQLIQRMITVDPRKRATLEEVKHHSWVVEGYDGPPENYLPKRSVLDPENLDKNIIQRMQAFGFKNEDVTGAFREYSEQAHQSNSKANTDKKIKFKVNPVVTTYFLLSEMLKREEARLLAAELREKEKDKQWESHEKEQQHSSNEGRNDFGKHDRKLSLQTNVESQALRSISTKKSTVPMSPSPLSSTGSPATKTSNTNLYAIAEDGKSSSEQVKNSGNLSPGQRRSNARHQSTKSVPNPVHLGNSRNDSSSNEHTDSDKITPKKSSLTPEQIAKRATSLSVQVSAPTVSYSGNGNSGVKISGVSHSSLSKDGKDLNGASSVGHVPHKAKPAEHSPSPLSPQSIKSPTTQLKPRSKQLAIEAEEDPFGLRRLSLQSVKKNYNQDKSSPASSVSSSPTATGSSSNIAATKKRNSANEVRQVSGWFLNVATTSSKSPDEIMAEVLKVCSLLSYAGVKCEKDHSSSWTLNIEVQVPTFNQHVEHTTSRNVTQASETTVSENDAEPSLAMDQDVSDLQMAPDEISDSSHTEDGENSPQSSPGRTVSNGQTGTFIRRISALGSDLLTKSTVVSFQIEICQVPRLNLYGLHFKRMTGSVWSYKSVCSRLLSRMTL